MKIACRTAFLLVMILVSGMNAEATEEVSNNHKDITAVGFISARTGLQLKRFLLSTTNVFKVRTSRMVIRETFRPK